MELYELSEEEVFDRVIDYLEEEEKRIQKEEEIIKKEKEREIIKSQIEKLKDKEKDIYNFFKIIDKINETRIKEGLIDIRENYLKNKDVVEINTGDITSFGVKVGTISEKDKNIFIEDIFYNKEDKEFKAGGQYGINGKVIDIKDENKVNLLIDGAEISTNLIPYAANTLGVVLEYDDGTYEYLTKDNFKDGQIILQNNEYDDNVYIYVIIMDFEKSVNYYLNLLILFGLKGFLEYNTEYFQDDDIMKILKDILIDNIEDIEYIVKNYDGTETNIGLGTQGANCFIDVSADNFNKYMEELLK